MRRRRRVGCGGAGRRWRCRAGDAISRSFRIESLEPVLTRAVRRVGCCRECSQRGVKRNVGLREPNSRGRPILLKELDSAFKGAVASQTRPLRTTQDQRSPIGKCSEDPRKGRRKRRRRVLQENRPVADGEEQRQNGARAVQRRLRRPSGSTTGQADQSRQRLRSKGQLALQMSARHQELRATNGSPMMSRPS